MGLSRETKMGMISAVFRGWLRLCRRTSTIEIEGFDNLKCRLWDERQGAIIALWHNRIAWCAAWAEERIIEEGRSLAVLISASRDGDLATWISRDIGLDVSRGSSSRRGLSGMREILRSAQKNPLIAFVVDGPRGPVYQSKRGVVEAARLTGFPIFPWTVSCNRAILLGSWDRLVVPFPFSKVMISVGDPIFVPRQASKEGMNGALEKIDHNLRTLTTRLDEESDLKQRAFAVGKARQSGLPEIPKPA